MRKINTNLNRKAILPATVLKMIIAVLCIVGLLMLAFKLYTMFTYKTAKEQATESLKQITDRIEGIQNGETRNFLLTSPKGWYLLFYPSSTVGDCGGKGCLCFCSNVAETAEECLKSGVCTKFENGEMNYFCTNSLDPEIKRDKNPNINLEKSHYKDQVHSYAFSRPDCMSLEVIPFEILFYKKDGKISIFLPRDIEANKDVIKVETASLKWIKVTSDFGDNYYCMNLENYFDFSNEKYPSKTGACITLSKIHEDGCFPLDKLKFPCVFMETIGTNSDFQDFGIIDSEGFLWTSKDILQNNFGVTQKAMVKSGDSYSAYIATGYRYNMNKTNIQLNYTEIINKVRSFL